MITSASQQQVTSPPNLSDTENSSRTDRNSSPSSSSRDPPKKAASFQSQSCIMPRLAERDALEPAPHHTPADRRVLEILRRARDCGDVDGDSNGPSPKRRFSNKNRIAICPDGSGAREKQAQNTRSASIVPPVSITKAGLDAMAIRPKAETIASINQNFNGSTIPLVSLNSAKSPTVSLPLSKNGMSLPPVNPTSHSANFPHTHLFKPKASKSYVASPTPYLSPISLFPVTQSTVSSPKQVQIGFELVLPNGFRIPVSATCADQHAESNDQFGVSLPTAIETSLSNEYEDVCLEQSPLGSVALSASDAMNAIIAKLASQKQQYEQKQQFEASLKSIETALKASDVCKISSSISESLNPNDQVVTVANATSEASLSPDSCRSRMCSCLRSNCLKLYCDCFAAGRACEGCNCRHCRNNITDEITRRNRDFAMRTALARNPLAFKSKIETTSGADGKHMLGCRCKRSHCLKNYCECYLAKISCSKRCRCVSCSNLEGPLPMKDGNENAFRINLSDSTLENIAPRPKTANLDTRPSVSFLSSENSYQKSCYKDRFGNNQAVYATSSDAKYNSLIFKTADYTSSSNASSIPQRLKDDLRSIALSSERYSAIQSLLISPSLTENLISSADALTHYLHNERSSNEQASPTSIRNNLPLFAAEHMSDHTLCHRNKDNQILTGSPIMQSTRTSLQSTINLANTKVTTSSPPADFKFDGTETVTVAAVDAPIDYSEYTEEELDLMQHLLERRSNLRNSEGQGSSENLLSENPGSDEFSSIWKNNTPPLNQESSLYSKISSEEHMSISDSESDSSASITIPLDYNRTRPLSLPSMQNSPQSSNSVSPTRDADLYLSAPASLGATSCSPHLEITHSSEHDLPVDTAEDKNACVPTLLRKIHFLERRVSKLMHVVHVQSNALCNMSKKVRRKKNWDNCSSTSDQPSSSILNENAA